MKYKVGDKFKGTAEIIERLIGIDKDSILTISKIENDLIYLNCENYNYVWCIKDDFNKCFIPFKDDNIIEYQGKNYEEVKQHNFMVGSFMEELKDYDKVLFLKEHKEEILDDIEKEYLGNVIKYVIEPTKNKIKSITKIKTEDMIDVFFNDNKVHKNQYHKIKKFYIRIIFENGEELPIPTFEDKRMYKGMVDNQPYTLEELGL